MINILKNSVISAEKSPLNLTQSQFVIVATKDYTNNFKVNFLFKESYSMKTSNFAIGVI